MSEFRYNKLTKQWVLFAPNRAKRPFDLQKSKEILLQDQENCPFELGNEIMTPNELARIEDEQGRWKCRVVPNLYNALSIEDENKTSKKGNFERRSGFGAHEVIIETNKHHFQMFDYKTSDFIDYLNIIKKRVEDLKKDKRLKYFSIFKNSGLESGASLEHSHTQLIAMPFLPVDIDKQLKEYEEFKEKYERSYFEDIIYDERNFKKGIVFENNFFLAYCPYASTLSFEIIIMAKEEISNLLECEDEHIYALSEIMELIFSKYKTSLGEIPFNMFIKNGDIQAKKGENPNRFHIQICPRIYKLAGFELESKIHINTILPELAAQIIKE